MNAMTKTTTAWPLHARFDGPIVMIGFGSIGRGTLPLIERHIGFDRSKFVVIAPDDEDRRLLDERKLTFIHAAITKDNYRDVLTPLLTAGPGRGMIVNLSVDASSVGICLSPADFVGRSARAHTRSERGRDRATESLSDLPRPDRLGLVMK